MPGIFFYIFVFSIQLIVNKNLLMTGFELLYQLSHNQCLMSVFLKKMGQSRPLFVYFRSFLVTISIQTEKSIDGVLGIQTQGHRMVSADETMELWRPLMPNECYRASLFFYNYNLSIQVNLTS